MKGLKVSLYAMTASFRDPNTHLYQESIPAPPPITIIGISGAALGMRFEEALLYFKKNYISVGCAIISEGIGKDLWNYSKISGKSVKKDILMREFMFGIDACLFFLCQNAEIITELEEAFSNPFFALTLGNSDELVKIKDIEIINEVNSVESKSIKDTWICGNYINQFELNWEKVKELPIKATIKPPIVKNLPVDFIFNDNDEREATKLDKFTFLGNLHQLKTPVKVYSFKDKLVPLYTFSEQ